MPWRPPERRASPFSTVPLPGPEPEVYVAAVEVPAHVRQAEPFEIGVTVRSTHDDQCTLRIKGAISSTTTRPIKRGQNYFRLSLQSPDEGLAAFTVQVTGCRDTLPENNEARCGVLVGPRPRVLLAESRPALARQLAAALVEQNLDVKVCTPQDIPAMLAELGRYDLLVLSNVPAAALSAERMEVIRRYVHELGGGLIAVGGDQSFTPGGYHGTTLEEVLPVTSEARKDKPKPTLAMVLVLDCSGSMEGKSISLAKQATRRAVEMLGPRDQVGVLAFEDKNWWASPLHPCTDKPQILSRIDTLRAGGETDMYPALDKAYLALREASADLKHIIVLTDGVSSPGDFDGLVRRIAASGITLSTLAVGEEAAGPLLEDLAEKANGHYYYCTDVSTVPKIFELETSIAGKLGITEEPFSPQLRRIKRTCWATST